jgi:hypothetical protein
LPFWQTYASFYMRQDYIRTAEKKAERREEVFLVDCKKAIDLGVREAAKRKALMGVGSIISMQGFDSFRTAEIQFVELK